MTTPQVSILIPFKNEQSYLQDCLDSILDQSYKFWEAILIDDHSTDESLVIVNQYVKRDVRIRVIENDGSGIINALRIGLKTSIGNFITRMDADDLMTPNKLSSMLTLLGQVGRGYVVTGLVEYFSSDTIGDGYKRYADWLNNLSSNENNFNEIYKECVIPSPCWMMDRNDLVSIGAFDNDHYPEDYDLCFRMYQNGLKVACVPAVIHRWRDHADRASRNDTHYADNRFLELKIGYFMRLDYNNGVPLFLWGAGKKGKVVAKILENHKIPFRWITNNTRKQGHVVFRTAIESVDQLRSCDQKQVIIAVAGPMDQENIRKKIEETRTAEDHYYWFC